MKRTPHTTRVLAALAAETGHLQGIGNIAAGLLRQLLQVGVGIVMGH